jgi:hypothetical protein
MGECSCLFSIGFGVSELPLENRNTWAVCQFAHLTPVTAAPVICSLEQLQHIRNNNFSVCLSNYQINFRDRRPAGRNILASGEAATAAATTAARQAARIARTGGKGRKFAFNPLGTAGRALHFAAFALGGGQQFFELVATFAALELVQGHNVVSSDSQAAKQSSCQIPCLRTSTSRLDHRSSNL